MRTDVHSPNNIVPSNYVEIMHYQARGGMFAEGFGYDCESELVYDGNGVAIGKNAHTSNNCCVTRFMATHNVTLAECSPAHSNVGLRCGVCGASFRSGSLYRHEPSGEYIFLGHDCAAKYELQHDLTAFELREKREQKRVKTLKSRYTNAQKREAWLALTPGLAEALKIEHRIIDSLNKQLLTKCELTEKQVELALKLAKEANEPKVEKVKGPEDIEIKAPVGRTAFVGTILSARERTTDFGTTIAISVKVQQPFGYWIAWGNAPKDVRSKAQYCERGWLKSESLIGKQVDLTATLEASDKPHFVFMKRPMGDLV